MRLRLLALLFLWCLRPGTCLGQQGSGQVLRNAAEFSIPSDSDALVFLTGKWRFHPGDDARWASSALDDAAWPLLRSDTPWQAQGYEHLSGYAWYRFKLRPANNRESIRLLLPPVMDGYDVFVDGSKVGSFGETQPHGEFRMPEPQAFDLPQPREGKPIQVALRVWADPQVTWSNGPLGTAEVGKPSVIDTQRVLQHTAAAVPVAQKYAVGLVEGTISLTVLALFLFRRAEREYLWFALLLLARALTKCEEIATQVSLLTIRHRDLIDSVLNPIFLIASLLFFAAVLEVPRTKAWRACLVLAALDPFVVSVYVFGFAHPAIITACDLAVTFPAELWILSVLFNRSFRGERTAQVLAVPTLLVYGLDVLDHVALSTMELGWQARVAYISGVGIPIPLYPTTLGDVAELIFVLSLLAFLIRRFARARALEERYSTDLEAARSLQRLLIPANSPDTPGLVITTAYWPAQEVGGDFFQITQRGDTDTLVLVGDVAGKGVAAAMTVSLLIGSVRSVEGELLSPSFLLQKLNRLLVNQGAGFTTAVVLSIRPDGLLRLANAGHPAPYRNGEELLCTPALPLGLDPDAEFFDSALQLRPGDQLTLITDGVPEAAHHKELFGFARTQALAKQGAAAIAQAARAFGQTDDITAVSILFQPPIWAESDHA